MDAFKKSDANMIRTAWELSAGLLSCVVAIGLGYWFGLMLDERLGTSPWLLMLFVGFGVTAGVLNVYRTVSGAVRTAKRDGEVKVKGRGGE